VQYLKRSSFSIPLWEEWVIRASCCSVKLLSSLFRVRARDPLNITRGVPSKRIRVKRVRQKHLNNWRWCFMVQWRTEWSLLWIQVEKQIGTDLKNSTLITLRRPADRGSVTRERAPRHSPAGHRTAVRSQSVFPAQCGFCQGQPKFSWKHQFCPSNNNGFSSLLVSFLRSSESFVTV